MGPFQFSFAYLFIRPHFWWIILGYPLNKTRIISISLKLEWQRMANSIQLAIAIFARLIASGENLILIGIKGFFKIDQRKCDGNATPYEINCNILMQIYLEYQSINELNKWRNSFWCDELFLLHIDSYPAIDRFFFSNLFKMMVVMLASNRIKLITKKCGIKTHPLKVKCARDSIVGYTNGGNMNGSNLTFSMTLLIFMKQSQGAWCFFYHSFFFLCCIHVLFNC